MTKYKFIVIDSKLLNDVIYVYGGLVPEGIDGVSMVDFRWFTLSEVKNK